MGCHQWLYHLLSLRRLIISLQPLYRIIGRSLMAFADAMLSVYFRCCNLSKFIVHLDDNETKVYIWAAKHPKCNKPNLVLIHGFGSNSKWQFIFQVRQLTHDFNVYIPDLVFFGESYSTKLDRSVWFQAKCVREGLKKMKVKKCSVYAISYGGFVGYQMAAAADDDEEEIILMVEKLVIVSSGIVCKHDSKLEHVNKIGRNVVDLLVAKTPEDLRMLCRMSVSKYDFTKWFPDFFLWGFIDFERCKREKEELVHELLMEKPDIDLLVVKQETLLVWGEKDHVFPVEWAYQLHRHLGVKSKLHIIKGVGHALNLEAPYSLNRFISTFVLGSSQK
uniref:uncharacterized protein LOC122608339 n=1 Tax=Erigeron canadensis TaxID=72917 RepID=UPI001CB95471|nr:uncharacterized protein LOC122608339 [Erigeron canadensis]